MTAVDILEPPYPESESVMSSTQKVAIVTGASQGIGAGLVAAYRKLGYAVVANSRSIAPSGDPLVLAVPGDIADPAVAQRVVASAVEAFGGVDTLVNNAGVFIAKPFTDYTAEDYETVTGVNLRAFFEVTRPAVAAMLTRGGGHIVNISTSLVDHANSNVPSALASLTKGGLNAVTRSLAVEYATRGIRVNTVAPGIIRTPMHPEATHEFLAGLHPVGRMGDIDDIVDAVLYLESAPFVTGEILHVDGGQSAGH
ncbi:3-oxoacyl-ACP reductase [Rugosimonospora africana]|uniref:3-oxoacyl-ACP reductase n=2 Tax=Rugosimonospora africana TaxID=556532 RepID=A0A8J3QTB8_9ACTN|nr:3-oxoacyl-ACP reductase [Rugosimonospora africana]